MIYIETYLSPISIAMLFSYHYDNTPMRLGAIFDGSMNSIF